MSGNGFVEFPQKISVIGLAVFVGIRLFNIYSGLLNTNTASVCASEQPMVRGRQLEAGQCWWSFEGGVERCQSTLYVPGDFIGCNWNWCVDSLVYIVWLHYPARMR